MTKKKRYKRYSPEFKREALMRASEEGVTDIIVCEELEIRTRQLRRWRDEFRLLGDDAWLDIACPHDIRSLRKLTHGTYEPPAP